VDRAHAQGRCHGPGAVVSAASVMLCCGANYSDDTEGQVDNTAKEFEDMLSREGEHYAARGPLRQRCRHPAVQSKGGSTGIHNDLGLHVTDVVEGSALGPPRLNREAPMPAAIAVRVRARRNSQAIRLPVRRIATRAGCSITLTPRRRCNNDFAKELVDMLTEKGLAYATLRGIDRTLAFPGRSSEGWLGFTAPEKWSLRTRIATLHFGRLAREF
jgi:hypothetical protein